MENPSLQDIFKDLNRELKILVLGLQGSGKSSFQKVLSDGPTNMEPVAVKQGSNHQVNLGQLTFQFCTSHETTALLSPNAEDTTNRVLQADAIIWIVDSTNYEQLPSCRDLFRKTADLTMNTQSPLLVLVNKNDALGASVSEVADKMQIFSIRNRVWFCQGVSVKTGDGLYEGLNWLTKKLEVVVDEENQ